MEIIVTHKNTDFDALASQIAASKLYPEAIRVVAGGIPPEVRKFMSLHMNLFELVPVREIDQEKVTRMIVVDVRKISRLSDYKRVLERAGNDDKNLEIHIYDHHSESVDDLPGHRVQVEEVGCTTTMLVEHLIKKKISLSSEESTVLALGIYSDTGSLTHSTTTARDADAVAWLIRQGANVFSLKFFLHSPLNKSHLKILGEMFAGSNLLVCNGLNIDIAMVSLEKRTTGLAGVVSEYNTLVGHEATFGLFCLKGNITIIGRSWHPRVDVGGILKKLGGGGHQGAGSANLKKSSLVQAKKELVAVLKQDPPIPIKISSIMTEKLVTLEHDLTIDKADIIFGEKKLRGAPVVQDSEIKGILSIKDIKKARLKNSAHLPVTAFMSQNVIEIESDLSVLRAFEKMSEHTIGRLVVVKNKKPVGIISRTDILNMVYGNG